MYVDGFAHRGDVMGVLIGDREAVLLLDGELDLDEGQRVESQGLEGRIRVVHHLVRRDADAVDQNVLEIVESELLCCHVVLLC